MAKKREDDRQKDLQFVAECFSLSFNVYPPIAMVKENALKLATNLSAHHDLTDIHMTDEGWIFQRPQVRQGQPKGMVKVEVEESEVSIEHQYPTGGLERFEMLAEKVLQSLGPVVKPQMILGNIITLAYVVEIGGDARRILLALLGLTGEGLDKMGVFKRPCHSVGLRFGFPPFRIKPSGQDGNGDKPAKEEVTDELIEQMTGGDDDDSDKTEAAKPPPKEKGSDWHATLTLETLMDEPNKLSIEVKGQWVPPLQWKGFVKATMERLKTVDDFLKRETTEFLEHFRSEP